MNKINVLVVDDEDDFRELAIKTLTGFGFHVEGVKTGVAALEILTHRDMDVVVLDIRMPGMNGLDILKWIKSHTPGVEVILLTGDMSIETGIAGMQLGAFDYVVKPAPMTELSDKVRQAYEKRQGRG